MAYTTLGSPHGSHDNSRHIAFTALLPPACGNDAPFGVHLAVVPEQQVPTFPMCKLCGSMQIKTEWWTEPGNP
eukprot:4495962-Pyramimonas_sp.AAC.1